MGVLIDNQKDIARLTERCRELEQKVERMEAQNQKGWWERFVAWVRG